MLRFYWLPALELKNIIIKKVRKHRLIRIQRKGSGKPSSSRKNTNHGFFATLAGKECIGCGMSGEKQWEESAGTEMTGTRLNKGNKDEIWGVKSE